MEGGTLGVKGHRLEQEGSEGGTPLPALQSTAKGEPPGAPPKNTDTAIQGKKGNRQRRAAKNK